MHCPEKCSRVAATAAGGLDAGGVSLGAFWVPGSAPIPEKSIGATGFEPAT